MHNIGVGGDLFDLNWKFVNRPISKLKHKTNLPLANNSKKKVFASNSMVMGAILA
jgi:hypothetical protein